MYHLFYDIIDNDAEHMHPHPHHETIRIQLNS